MLAKSITVQYLVQASLWGKYCWFHLWPPPTHHLSSDAVHFTTQCTGWSTTVGHGLAPNSPVHPVSESRGGPLSVTNERTNKRTEILVSNIEYHQDRFWEIKRAKLHQLHPLAMVWELSPSCFHKSHTFSPIKSSGFNLTHLAHNKSEIRTLRSARFPSNIFPNQLIWTDL